MTKSRQVYNKIKAYLVENGIKHRDVAEVINTKPNTVSKKLNGLGSDFTLEEAKSMHMELGVPIAYFFEPNVPKREQKRQHKENQTA